MKRLALFILVSVFAIYSYGQTPYTVTYVTNFAPIQLTVLNPTSSVNKIKGSPYLNEDEEFKPGGLIVDDTVRLTDMKLRYNAYSQQFEIKDGDDIKALIAKDRIKSVILMNQQFDNRLHYNGEIFEKGYLEVLYKGKIKMYKKHLCKVKEGYYNATVDAGDKNDKFTHDEEYYVMLEEYENPKKVFFSKRNFLNLFGDKKKKVKQYMKDNRLKHKRKQDLVTILTYYETL